MFETDLAYFERRAREELEAAASATSGVAASAHRALAEQYDAKAEAIRSTAEQLPDLTIRMQMPS